LSYVSGAQGVLDLAASHQHARSMLGLTEPVYAMKGRCRCCGWSALRVRAGSDTIWCEHCRDTMTRDEYDQRQLVFARRLVA
jgi:hypothetical protein